MKLKDIKSIDIYSRWWRDVENGNPYYARKVVVGLKDGSEKVFSVRATWGDVDRVENDKVEDVLGLPKSVRIVNRTIFRIRNHRLTYCRSINYKVHEPVRVWQKNRLDNPARFKNI